jgi:hypothetical protein
MRYARRVLDLSVEIDVARRRIVSGGPARRADANDKAGCDQERRPHLRPIGHGVVSADFHGGIIDEGKANTTVGVQLARPGQQSTFARQVAVKRNARSTPKPTRKATKMPVLIMEFSSAGPL